MATKTEKPRKITHRKRGRLSANLFLRNWSYDGEMPDDESMLRGMATDTPFRVSGAAYVQLDKTEK
jgi:hypothetical protein